MLIQSKNKNEKIILGLLSYTLEEGQHQTDLLQSILETYRQSDSKEIYLYREQDQDNFIGLVGVETFQSPGNESEHPESVVIDRIALFHLRQLHGLNITTGKLMRNSKISRKCLACLTQLMMIFLLQEN